MMHYFDLSQWGSVEQIEEVMGRDFPAGRYHGKIPHGYLEWDDTRNGCAYDWPKTKIRLLLWWKNNRGIFHTPERAYPYSPTNFDKVKRILRCV